MAPNPRLQDERLARLYAEVPDVECLGRCQDSCTAIGMSVRERRVAEDALGGPVTCAPDGVCSALGADGRCRIYDRRPMVCRLWGAAEAMPCPHGCRPRDGGTLLTHEGAGLLQAAAHQAGGPGSMREVGREMDILVRALQRDPERLERLRRDGMLG
jgi:hypothetical protein